VKWNVEVEVECGMWNVDVDAHIDQQNEGRITLSIGYLGL
jgi:hypothetical protein